MNEVLRNFSSVIECQVTTDDIDSFEHVNNVVYMRYLEMGRIAYFERIGVLEVMQKTKVGPILHSVQCRFRAPLAFPDSVLVGTQVSELCEDRFTMKSIVVSKRTSRIVAEGISTIVMFNYATGSKVGISPTLRGQLISVGS